MHLGPAGSPPCRLLQHARGCRPSSESNTPAEFDSFFFFFSFFFVFVFLLARTVCILVTFFALRLITWHGRPRRCPMPPVSPPWWMTLSTSSILKSDLCPSPLSVCYRCVTKVGFPRHTGVTRNRWNVCENVCVRVARVWVLVWLWQRESSPQPCCISR